MDPTARSFVSRPLRALLHSPVARALVHPRSVEDYVGLFHPTWSLTSIRARVVEVRREDRETTSLYVEPNAQWPGFRAGQFVVLTATVNGARVSRPLSLACAPEDGLPLRLTMRAVPGGRLSEWVRHVCRVGHVMELSAPAGEFVLPEPRPQRLLFVTGGSGVTPVVAILRHLAATGYTGAVASLHFARGPVLFEEELRAVTRRFPAAQMHIQRTGGRAEDAPRPRLDAEALARVVPDWPAAEAFVCGPAPLLDAAETLWESHGAAARLHVERFTPPKPAPVVPGAAHRITFARSGRQAVSRGALSLLAEAELAGAQPASGCRMGICRTCVCRKASGTVRDTLTGELRDTPGERIRLCVSAAVSDVTLDL